MISRNQKQINDLHTVVICKNSPKSRIPIATRRPCLSDIQPIINIEIKPNVILTAFVVDSSVAAFFCAALSFILSSTDLTQKEK